MDEIKRILMEQLQLLHEMAKASGDAVDMYQLTNAMVNIAECSAFRHESAPAD